MRIYIRPQLPDPPDIDDLIFDEEGNHSIQNGLPAYAPRRGVVFLNPFFLFTASMLRPAACPIHDRCRYWDLPGAAAFFVFFPFSVQIKKRRIYGFSRRYALLLLS